MTEKIEVVKTRRGFPAYWVGGGAFTNTFEGQVVLPLKTPIFVRGKGDLANKLNQALVPLSEGDVIIYLQGTRPASPENPDVYVRAFRVVSIDSEKAEAQVEQIDFNLDNIPPKVWEGLSTYHNRDGKYFTADPPSWGASP